MTFTDECRQPIKRHDLMGEDELHYVVVHSYHPA